MMSPAAFALNKRTVLTVLMSLLVGARVWAYQRLVQLEAPAFTIKPAMVSTERLQITSSSLLLAWGASRG